MAREMREVDALEGPEIGSIMAAAMRQRQRNDTTASQRAAMLRNLVDKGWLARGRGNIVEAPGARQAAGEAAMADDAMWRERIQNIHAMERVEDRDIALAQRAASMAAATGRGLQFQADQGQVESDLFQDDLDLMAAQQSAETPSGTPGGFTVTGDNPYTPGGPSALGQNLGEAEAVDTVARNALEWVNNLFRKDIDEQAQVGAEGQQQSGVVATGLGDSQELSPEEQQQLQSIEQNLQSTRPDQNADSTVSWAAIGDQGNRTRDLNQGVLDKIEAEGLGGQGSKNPGGFQSGTYDPNFAQLPGESFMDYTKRMHQMRSSGQQAQPTSGANADEIIGSLLERYGSQLKMAGYGAQVEKFASGNYTKADIDGLIGQFGGRLPKDVLEQLQQVSESMVEVEELAGLDPNYARFQGTTSSGSSHYGPATDVAGNKLGFSAKNYNPEVGRIQADKYGRLQEEDFMDYTKRMHERLYPSG